MRIGDLFFQVDRSHVCWAQLAWEGGPHGPLLPQGAGGGPGAGVGYIGVAELAVRGRLWGDSSSFLLFQLPPNKQGSHQQEEQHHSRDDGEKQVFGEAHGVGMETGLFWEG